jgi:16S rRNA (guanine966-N2)-methyltransferase
MRVISGKYRGRRLQGPAGNQLRPTGDRLKETLFNILRPHLPGAVLLDAFAGTGAIGIESLSCGAREVLFIESSQEHCRIIRHNLERCGVTEGFRILAQDVFKSLRQLGREGWRFDLAFLDPPYDWGPYGDLLHLLFHAGVTGPQSLVIFEHHRSAILPDAGDGFSRGRVVIQGDKRLTFYLGSAATDRDPG